MQLLAWPSLKVKVGRTPSFRNSLASRTGTSDSGLILGTAEVAMTCKDGARGEVARPHFRGAAFPDCFQAFLHNHRPTSAACLPNKFSPAQTAPPPPHQRIGSLHGPLQHALAALPQDVAHKQLGIGGTCLMWGSGRAALHDAPPSSTLGRTYRHTGHKAAHVLVQQLAGQHRMQHTPFLAPWRHNRHSSANSTHRSRAAGPRSCRSAQRRGAQSGPAAPAASS